MFLRKSQYVSGYSFSGDDKEKYDAIIAIMGWENDVSEDTPSMDVSATVAYWRKANAIHSWFVRECAGGVDECQPIPVSREKLNELLTIAKKAASDYDEGDKVESASVLAPTSGFFFGSTEVDEWFRSDLKLTIDQIEKALANAGPYADFIYQASW
jgi:hypothetical protein